MTKHSLIAFVLAVFIVFAAYWAQRWIDTDTECLETRSLAMCMAERR